VPHHRREGKFKNATGTGESVAIGAMGPPKTTALPTRLGLTISTECAAGPIPPTRERPGSRAAPLDSGLA